MSNVEIIVNVKFDVVEMVEVLDQEQVEAIMNGIGQILAQQSKPREEPEDPNAPPF